MFGGIYADHNIVTSTNIGVGKDPIDNVNIYDADNNVGMHFQIPTFGETAGDGYRIGLNATNAFLWNFEAIPFAFATSGIERLRIEADGDIAIDVSDAKSKLHVNGGIQMADDTDVASADKVGTLKYYVSGNNSYVDMCMQTGIATYAWVNIKTNSW